MVNPTHLFRAALNAFQDSRYFRLPLHETADGDFVNASPNTPLPVGFPEGAKDAFGKLRVTTPTTLFEYAAEYDMGLDDRWLSKCDTRTTRGWSKSINC